MEAKIRSFEISNLPHVVRIGFGSEEPLKKWARFEVTKKGEFYWASGLNIHEDVDSTNIHLIIHQSGEIHTSHYTGKGKEQKKVFQSAATTIGSELKDLIRPYNLYSGSEYLEPAYVYSGLVSLRKKDKKNDLHHTFVACIDQYLINSKLVYSLDIAPRIEPEQIINSIVSSLSWFGLDEKRCHMYMFHYGKASIVISLKFIEGSTAIDNQKLLEADKNKKPMKRLFHHERLDLSESVSLIAKAKKQS